MLKNTNITLVSLCLETTKNYETNLQTLITLILQTKENSIIVAPEVCLTGFDYDNYDALLNFSDIATKKIKEISQNKIIILTMLEKIDNEVYNVAKVFHNQNIVHQQAKSKLFKFGNEHKFMKAGDDKDIKIFDIDGIKIAILVCFELRFKDLWQKIEGADIIAIPAWWGKLREENFKVLTQALSVINQCYVICSDSKNEECTAQSGIITPFGQTTRNENKNLLELSYSKYEIYKMRKYIDVGIK